MARPEGSGDTNDSNGPAHSSNQSVRRRVLRPNILSLSNAAPPSPDITREEGYHLFNGFMHEELMREHVPLPNVQIELPTSHYRIPFASPMTSVTTHSATSCPDGDALAQSHAQSTQVSGQRVAASAVNDPSHFKQLGQEIRQLADEFNNSPQGQTLKEKANKVNLEHLSFADLQALLTGVFEHGKFDRTTIVAVFIFCSSLVVRALRSQAIKISRNIIKWCFDYIRDRVCVVVQQQGGWDVVFGGVIGLAVKVAAMVVAIASTIGFGYFLFKK